MVSIADEAPHILVVDDDRRIRELLRSYLCDQGFRVTTAEDAAAALTRLKSLIFDLVIVDIMMPGENGLELTRTLRATDDDVPILILSALTESNHRIEGLESGSDDYLPKPFEPRELVLRINNLLRRRISRDKRSEIRLGELVFNIERGELSHDGGSVRLTTRERELLRIFALRAGEPIAREELAGPNGADNARTVDVQINRLRRKIEKDPSMPAYLQTVRGMGYILYSD